MTKVLLTGAGGQLGLDICEAARSRPELSLHSFTRADLDITDAAHVRDVLAAVEPDVVIHAAAYTAVDDCETNEQHAVEVNGNGTANIVAGARSVGARVIYVSTDYVFDGTKETGYVETDAPNPASAYGRSKLLGENAVLELGTGGLVVRTSWVCGVHGSNMVKTIMNAAAKYPQLTFVDDQVGKPTFTADLAHALLTLSLRQDHGIMHVTNEGVVSWYEFCRAVLQALGKDPAQVTACATSELDPPRPAPRPANSVLENTRFVELGLKTLRPYEEALEDVVRDLTS